MPHVGVMKEEISSLLKDVPEGYFIDATYGDGSHFEFIDSEKKFTAIGFDRDYDSIAGKKNNHNVVQLNFSKIYDYLEKNSFTPISGILYDLGVSSHQIDTPSRGFSYSINSDLDMRMNQQESLTAENILNSFSYEELKLVFQNYGEERYSSSIAKKIVDNRPIYKTKDLVKLIKDALPKQNPIYIEKSIRRIFQAIRIQVNNELDELRKSLTSIKDVISKNGVIVCISYHSLEDKIVKNFMNELTIGCTCEPSIAICVCNNVESFKFPNKKKYYPSNKEIETNSRAKSATLRYVIKL